MTAVIFFMGILSVRSDKTFAYNHTEHSGGTVRTEIRNKLSLYSYLKSPFREYISLFCALGGGRSVPESARLCYTSANMEYIAAGLSGQRKKCS